MINYDKRLLKNFYLNKGFYNVVINSSYAKVLDNQEFELIFNIEANPKLFFGKLSLDLPTDFLKSNYENIEKENRIDFWIGIGTATWSVAIFSTVVGYAASDFLNKDMLIGLAIINPIYFICMMIGAMKTMQISLSVILGAILGPAFYFFSPEWSILFGGFFAGTIAFFIGEKNGN